MSEHGNDLDLELAELGRATEPIRARAGFSERVMAAVQAESFGWRDELVRSARRVVPALALAAVVAVVWAVSSDVATDEALAVAEDTVELEW